MSKETETEILVTLLPPVSIRRLIHLTMAAFTGETDGNFVR